MWKRRQLTFKDTSYLIIIIILFTTVLYLKCTEIREKLPCSLAFPLVQLHLAGQPVPELLPRELPIWMVETSGRVKLTGRELCALESAALHNPNQIIYFLLTNPRLEDLPWNLEYPNIHFRYLHLDNFFHETPLGNIWKSGQLRSSNWPVSHLSDLVRYLLLYEYGGTYLDTDVISLRNLPNFTNFAGIEYSKTGTIGAGALRFYKQHPVIQNIVHRLEKEYDGTNWGWNGPGILTQVLKDTCRLQDISWPETCSGIQILKQEVFYAVNWREVDMYFHGERGDLEKRLRSSIATHIWGKKTSSRNLTEESPLYRVMQENCPFSSKLLL
ncbi:lactosylceramide 4-alpha-galactosyltransferase isoform X2 [Eurytemora carolleeae]|uniref:lactosylceramide 4-alpha-galactosyltransferase isoform X2 n=1 Tax=Eurytemora carolleeae TaxID=1294199 RepID=UPI000C788B8B|nr:lactosylceramide 4-alpha-galactosyltransferase isoform X2 [Eurytemora carolleeae]|eukprot:XP_023321906.1 lactosylceramide 4-alpha-galactosyltransferase-like isoform X2 [Eurytemora affinis]